MGGECKLLHTLNLSHCTAVADIKSLGKCTSLQTLSLSYCGGLSDVSALKNCDELLSADLSCCDELADVSALARCKELHTLNLSHCHLVEEEVVADEYFDEVVDLSDDESSDECDNGQFDEVMELSDDESDVESEAEETAVTVIRSEPVFEVTLADDYDESEDEQIFDVPSDDESEDDTMGRFDEAVYLTDDDDSDE